jgi:hypothetical protein
MACPIIVGPKDDSMNLYWAALVGIVIAVIVVIVVLLVSIHVRLATEPHIRARRKAIALAQRGDYEALRTHLIDGWYWQTAPVLVELGTNQAVELLDEQDAHGGKALEQLGEIAKSGKTGSGLALTCLKKHAARDWPDQYKAKEMVWNIDPSWAVDSFLKRMNETAPPILDLLYDAHCLATVLPKERLPQVAERFDKLCNRRQYREIRHLLPSQLARLEHDGIPVSEAIFHLRGLIESDPTEADKFIGEVREIQDRIAKAPSPPEPLPQAESVLCLCFGTIESASEVFAGMVVRARREETAPGWFALGKLRAKEGEIVPEPYWIAYPATEKMDSWRCSFSSRAEELGLDSHGRDHFYSNSEDLLSSTIVISVFVG